MDEAEIIEKYNQKANNTDYNASLAAMSILLDHLRVDKSGTLVGLLKSLKDVSNVLVLKTECFATTSVSSGCDLFLRFITLAALEMDNFEEVKQVLIKRGEIFLKKARLCPEKIVNFSLPFVKEGLVILTHSKSRMVIKVLKHAAKHKRFTTYVTESCPNKSGLKMEKALNELNIPVTLILDAAVGYIMEKIDVVILGAEGVAENGGIINKIGSYQIALCAKAFNKPVYVVAESYKFCRLFPLKQSEIPNHIKYNTSVMKKTGDDLSKEHPNVDYTPPELINFLITDLGVLTPTAVTDELMNTYL